MKVKVKCEHCEKIYQMDDSYVGRTAKCPYCHNHFVMITFEEQPSIDVFNESLKQDESDAGALFERAHAFEKGNGVEKDMAEAGRLYILAASQGHGFALMRLNIILFGEKNAKIVEQWLGLARQKGLTEIAELAEVTLQKLQAMGELKSNLARVPEMLEKARLLDEMFADEAEEDDDDL